MGDHPRVRARGEGVALGGAFAGAGATWTAQQGIDRTVTAVVVGAAYPRRIWTTNYDDLIEEAARQVGVAARALDPAHRAANAALTIAHLHGFLPSPVADRLGDADPRRAQVIFSEEEFHASTADVVGWTNRELHRLFDEHRLLVLGMSLDDPNVRRALAATAREAAAAAPRHMALLRPLALDAAEFPGVDAATLTACAAAMNAARLGLGAARRRGRRVARLRARPALPGAPALRALR